MSAVVMMPANLPAPPAKGRNWMSSSVAVAERRMSGTEPAVWVKMFWAEVAREVPVAAPRTGVTRVGVSAKTKAPDPVSSEITPSSSAEVVAAKTDNLLLVYVTVPPAPKATDELSVPVKVKVLEAVKVLPSAIVKVAEVAGAVRVSLLIVVAVATPRTGVTKVGEVARTAKPDPVSSLKTPANWAEVVAEKTDRSLVVKVTVPVVLGKVMVLSVVGSVMAKVVSKSLAVPPSKIRGEAPRTVPVKVMVSVPASPRVTLSWTERLPAMVAAPVVAEPDKIKLLA